MYSTLDSSGFSSGEEFVVAVNEGNKLNSKIVLGDRDVDVTLERVGKAVKKDFRSLLTIDSKKDSLMSALIADNTDPSGGEVNLNALVESMLLPNNVVKLTEEFQEASPNVYRALVGERDEYMAAGLNDISKAYTADFKHHEVVAVVGAAHVAGITNYLSREGWVLDCNVGGGTPA